ncbi:MAG TPA: restriction endonuclease subunit S [Hydrogenophaga sp.]|uniref:restriction endonuclease subunit S n=1 Tax=Hydrogenophaga sp. TaxID=1904254 RepID=UPI002C92688F|nr:restriction endonuclease subunit S [Hydrogenophaga sp.]HMN94034.1 restriction endonuclease subunit S [Hydrogenophaga sp.]HMP11837.1 restriction endonuclease subunit S [Hydrogenophaga sp.]
MSAVLEAHEPSAKYLGALQPRLVQHFELLGTAPGGVAKLRELILMLAVQGKLVSQDPSDEPASELLRRISAEKYRLTAAKKFKTDRPRKHASEAEKRFELPQGWEWIRLGEVFSLEYGSSLPAKERLAGDVPVFGSNGVVGFHTDALISEPSLIIGRKGSVGEVNLSLVPFWPIDTSYYVTPPKGIDLLFAFHLLKALKLGRHDKATAIPGINRNDVYAEMVGLPPTAEQSRIVTRVEELMRLCDALETQGRLEAAQHAQLVQTLLGALTVSATPEELADNWQRVATHFDLLLDRPEAVDALEQTILQLAVRGLLVPQDPNDEPASALLQKIRAEKDRLIAEGKIKREKPMEPVAIEEVPFVLPTGWSWVRFDELIHPLKPIAYGVLVPGPDVEAGVPFVRIADLSIDNPAPMPEKSIGHDIDRQFQRTRLEGGEILMGVVGSIGKLGVAPPTWAGANIARAICRIVPADGGLREFVLFLLQTGFMQQSFVGDTRTLAQPTLNVGLIRQALTPVPPPAEQARIVARVGLLRRLCADLRQRLAARQTTQAHLAEALIEEVA